MISVRNLRNIADRESDFNVTVENLESRMTELAYQGHYYIEYSDTNVHIIQRLIRYFERADFEVERLSAIRIRIYWW